MIQLRRVRSSTTAPDKRYDSAFDPNVVAESLPVLFRNLEEYVSKIPPSERWNVYYTVGDTNADVKRDWHGQDVIPFDIDDIVDKDGNFDEARYLDVIFGTLGVDRQKCAAIASGNGLQILVQVERKIEDKGFFRRNIKAYVNLCASVEAALAGAALAGKVDTSSFAPNRILRLPGTQNRKPGRQDRMARAIFCDLQPQPFFLCPAPGEKPDPAVAEKKDQLSDKQLSFFAIDTPSVEAECLFLRHCREHPADVNEPQWYAMLSIVGRLAGGREKVHAYSKDHAGYSEKETDRKLDQALGASGPRTCENIDHNWGQCHTCPHYKKVASPISLKSETFIATEKSGFYLLSKSGSLTPQFEDLRRYFQRERPYRTHAKSGLVYVFDGQRYGTITDTEMRAYAHDHFDPKPSDAYTHEFCNWVNRTNLVDNDWFKDSVRGKINFRNGVYDLNTRELTPHGAKYGFLYVLPYDYDPAATCPTFDHFMANITMGDEDLQRLLLEYVGYGICDRDYWLQKAVLLIGEGSNGKSTFLSVVRALSGDENVSHLSMYDIHSETSRMHLEGKLFNISDELPNYNMKNTELLKKLLGGTMTMRRLYHDSVTAENTAKFIFAGNEIPATNDTSEGLFRRLVIVPFTAKFKLEPTADGTSEPADVGLLQRMHGELPGIFNRVMRAYRDLKARGYLIEAKRATAELDRYRDEVDRVGSWVKENLYWNGSWTDDKPTLELATAFERYVSDAKRGEERPMTRYHFLKHLRRHVDHWDDRYTRIRVGQERPYVLRGVTFRKDMPQKDHF